MPSSNQLQIRKRPLYFLEKIKARLSLLSGKHESILNIGFFGYWNNIFFQLRVLGPLCKYCYLSISEISFWNHLQSKDRSKYRILNQNKQSKKKNRFIFALVKSTLINAISSTSLQRSKFHIGPLKCLP